MAYAGRDKPRKHAQLYVPSADMYAAVREIAERFGKLGPAVVRPRLQSALEPPDAPAG